MSWKPQALGFFAPASCVTLSLFCSYQAMSARTPLPATGASLPARQAYSHSASVGKRAAPPSAALTRLRNVAQSCHEMFSTGLSGLRKREWLLRMTLSHCRWVTSCLPSQKPRVSVT